MRAECRIDVARAMVAMQFDKLTITPIVMVGMDVPDVEVTFTSRHTLGGIIDILKDIPDGHVMAETVSIARLYNGERKRDCI